MTDTNTDPTTPGTSQLLSDRLYDWVKKLVQIVIPAVSSAYFAFAQILGLPNAEKVVGCLAVLATLLGSLLALSKKSYVDSGAKYDGGIVVTQDQETGVKLYTLELDMNPDEISAKQDITFKVVNPDQ